MRVLKNNMLDKQIQVSWSLEIPEEYPINDTAIEEMTEREIADELTQLKKILEGDKRDRFDIAIQSELINTIGEQIALDIDREIMNDMYKFFKK